MHEGHRARVREKYKLSGLTGFADHEVLELLLFYANKRSDTNAAAHRLLETFGSLSAVLEAPYEELVKVPEIGDVAATLITMVPELFRRYMQNKSAKTDEIKSAEQAAEYLVPKFYGLTEERVALLCLDSQQRLNNCSFIAEGSVSLAQIDVCRAVQTALRSNASSVILAHNHPGGVAAPSQTDIATTQTLAAAFKTVGLRLSDHVILCDSESFSMASHPKFTFMFG